MFVVVIPYMALHDRLASRFNYITQPCT